MDKPFSSEQISRQKRLGVFKSVLLVVVALGGLTLLLGSLQSSLDREDIRIAEVTRGNIQTGVSTSGVLLPKFEETIASHIDSHLLKTFVQNGQKVHQGQTLVQLDTTKLQLALDKDLESIAIKDNQIEMLGHDLAQQVSDLSGKVELLNIDLESRRTRYERLSRLGKVGGSSAHEIKEAQLDIKRTEIEIKQLNKKIENLKASTKTRIAGLRLEKSIVEKNRKETERLLAKATVKAPMDGLVVWLKDEEGSAVSNGQPLVKIADTSGFKISAGISDFYTNQLYQGMMATFDYDGKQYRGEVETIVAGDSEGGLQLMIRLLPDQPIDALRQRLRVELNLVTAEHKDTLMLAKGPFIKGGGLQKVFVMTDDGAVRTEVRVGSSNRDYYQIKSGLKAGDRVIISDVSEYAHLNQIRIN